MFKNRDIYVNDLRKKKKKKSLFYKKKSLFYKKNKDVLEYNTLQLFKKYN